MGLHVDALVAVADGRSQEGVAHLRAPRTDVGLGLWVRGQDLEDTTDRHAADALLGLEERAGTGAPTGVGHLGRFESVECGGFEHGLHGSFLPVVAGFAV
jgi:hypothetical protein